jgi:hypothetical protein
MTTHRAPRTKHRDFFVAVLFAVPSNTYLSNQRANRKGGEKLVTSKQRTGSKAGAIALLFSSAVMLFTLMFGGVAHADETATTANAGVAGANTGGNGAAGNGSDNEAESEQTSEAEAGGDAVAPNNGNSGNSSTGNASITTGDATATGNSATNTTEQTVVEGHNGVVSITDQNATIFNGGVAFANTGGNVAIGNPSDNDIDADQDSDVDGDGDAVATNDATVRNESGGDARITTGDATATGSTSNNTIRQVNEIDCPDCLGVVVLGDQNATIVNVGIGIANTGGNAAIGNHSENEADLDQDRDSDGGDGDAVGANTLDASNNSTGSAGIITGDATAVGNVATNNVTQITKVNAPNANGVIVLTDQNASSQTSESRSRTLDSTWPSATCRIATWMSIRTQSLNVVRRKVVTSLHPMTASQPMTAMVPPASRLATPALSAIALLPISPRRST